MACVDCSVETLSVAIVTEHSQTHAFDVNNFLRRASVKLHSDYEPYFEVVPIEVENDQSLFWSGTFELVGLISCMCSTGADVVSSTNTPSSEIINQIGENVCWCGIDGGGIQKEGLCPRSVTNNFWVQFSTEFAQAAQGTIFYIGYGEKNGGTFQSTSFFAKYELTNLEYPRVTRVVVIVVHRKGEGESCGEGTLVTLKNTLNEKNLPYICYNVFGNLMDPNQIQDLSVCSSKIITAEQEGMEPEPDSCFEKGGSDVLIGEMWIIVLPLLITFLYSL